MGDKCAIAVPLAEQRAAIESWRRNNSAKLGTPEFQQSTLVHRALTDVIENDTPETRAALARVVG